MFLNLLAALIIHADPIAIVPPEPAVTTTVCVTKAPTGPIVLQPAIGFDISALFPAGPIVEAPDGTLHWFTATGGNLEAWFVPYVAGTPGKAPRRYILVLSPDQRPVP